MKLAEKVKLVEPDITKAVTAIALKEKPVWDISNEISSTKDIIKNRIAESKEIEELIVKAAFEGLNAQMVIFTKAGPKVVDDHRTRYLYWNKICEMKGWSKSPEVNIDARIQTLNITKQEEEILKKYEGK